MSVPESHSTKAGPVAVIAVHGVADQRRDDTAVKAANLFLHLDQVEPASKEPGPCPSYTGFEQEKIRVGVEPLDVSDLGDEDAWKYQLRQQVKDYEGEGTSGAYETVRMEGQRTVREGDRGEASVDRDVHVYEMHWADASRLKLGILNIFRATYRLLFETSWLGLQSIGPWASFGEDVGRLSKFTSLRGIMMLLHTISSVILTRLMPVLYLLMAGMLMLTAIPVVESGPGQMVLGGVGGYAGILAFSLVVLLIAALVGIASLIWSRVPWPLVFVVLAVLSFLAWNLLFAELQRPERAWIAEAGVALVGWLVFCALLITLVIPGLNRRFRGTRVAAVVLMIYLGGGLLAGLLMDAGASDSKREWPLLLTGPVLALRLGFALMPFIWMILATSANLFLILALVESGSLFFRRWLGKDVIQRKRARLRTAILSITMPVLLISFLNSTLFQLMLIPAHLGGVDGAVVMEGRAGEVPLWLQPLGNAVTGSVEPFADQWSNMPSFEGWAEQNQGRDVAFSDYTKFASERMVVPFLEAVFLLVLLVLGYSLWIVTPAVLAEYVPGKMRRGKKWDNLSVALGRNLSQGYHWIWFGQLLLVFCLLATEAMFALRGVRSREYQDGHLPQGKPLLALMDQFLGVRPLTESEEDGGETLVALEDAPVPPSGLPNRMTTRSPNRESALRGELPRPGGGRPLAGPRPPRPSSIQAQRAQARGPYLGQAGMPMQQRSYREREEIEKKLQEIWERRSKEQMAIQKSAAPKMLPPDAGAEASESEVSPPPPGRMLKTLTEMVLFFNSGPLTSAFGVAVLFLAIGYLFFARLVDPLIAGLRGGLDIALDVVNYLRPHPKEATSRALILSRYASLLKYIVNWRDPRNPSVGYSRIVILAHSQGSVITSDLLRALNQGSVARDNGLEALSFDPSSPAGGVPVRLFSMGSPLRQLYAARFPDLYPWKAEENPLPQHRGMQCWWNAYRSGDYVGRMLFRDFKDADRFVPGREFVLKEGGTSLPVKEVCIGPGAHTHYWDETAPSVIRDLDRLVTLEDAELVPPDPAETTKEA